MLGHRASGRNPLSAIYSPVSSKKSSNSSSNTRDSTNHSSSPNAMASAAATATPSSHNHSVSLTMHHSLNAISPSPSHSHMAVGGRELLKILSLNESSTTSGNQYSLKVNTNLRVGKINRNYGVIDLKWHPSKNCEQYLASAPTNGALVIWNLGKSHSKMERVFKEHTRTVNRICWQPNEYHTLWSGSQDGSVRMWDIRDTKSTRVFQCNGEVRDLQVSPFHHTFVAVGTEAGTIQIWDIRNTRTPHSSIAAHDGLVLSVKWHPRYKSLIASGGRDRMVKVWDLAKTSRPKYAIQTISTVSRILWRPNHPHQLTTASTISDNAVHVWDIHRPHLPILSYKHHKDVVTGMFWLHDAPNDIVSCSKDSKVAVQMFQDAEQPRTTMRAVDFDVSHTNDVVFVGETIDRTPLEPSTFKISPLLSSSALQQDGSENAHQQGALPFGSQQQSGGNDEIHLVHDQSDYHTSHEHYNEPTCFEYFAKHYVFFDPKYSVPEKCLVNAKASESVKEYQKEKVWLLLRQLYLDYKSRLEWSHGGAHQLPQPLSDMHSDMDSTHDTFDEDDEESDLDEESDEEEGNDLFLTQMDADESLQNGNDEDLLNVELQNEPTFFEKDDDSDDGISETLLGTYASGGNGVDSAHDLLSGSHTRSHSFNNNFFVESPTNWHLASSASNGGLSPQHPHPFKASPTALQSHSLPRRSFEKSPDFEYDTSSPAPQLRFYGDYSKLNNHSASQKASVNILDYLSPSISNTMFESTARNLLQYYSEMGDIQMCVAILAILAETNIRVTHRATMEWQLCYIDMLRRRKLFLCASSIIKYSSEAQIRNMSLNNTTVLSCCSQCFKTVEGAGQMVCEKCKKKFACFLCHLPCPGMWFCCQKCGCGGHLQCMMNILKKQGRCPRCLTPMTRVQGV